MSVGPAEPGAASLPFEDRELMAQRQDLESEIVPTSEHREWIAQNDPKSGQPNTLILNPSLRESIVSNTDGLSATHSSFRRWSDASCLFVGV
jgi:hypothetical protein